MAWPAPIYSRNQVKNSGKAYQKAFERDGYAYPAINVSPNDYQIVENWRASHGAVLNTAQAWLRRLDKSNSPVFGQRLKRYSTIIDKMTTGRSVDLSTMNDIAGVRGIFKSELELRNFQELMSASRAKHELTHDNLKFDYIQSPKTTGYRGVHQVYKRNVSGAPGARWNGLKFEVQLRTSIQHAWATAVEIYDSTKGSRFKFEKSEDPAYLQFRVISELFARVHENRVGPMPKHSDTELVALESELETKSHMVATIENLVTAENYGQLKKNTILKRTKSGLLHLYRFDSLPAAIRAISAIEDQADTEPHPSCVQELL